MNALDRAAELRRESPERLEAISLGWEIETGADSIPTIERVYDRSPGGAYRCVWPNCSFARKDSAEMWLHVHSHGKGYLPPADFDWGKYL